MFVKDLGVGVQTEPCNVSSRILDKWSGVSFVVFRKGLLKSCRILSYRLVSLVEFDRPGWYDEWLVNYVGADAW